MCEVNDFVNITNMLITRGIGDKMSDLSLRLILPVLILHIQGYIWLYPKKLIHPNFYVFRQKE